MTTTTYPTHPTVPASTPAQPRVASAVRELAAALGQFVVALVTQRRAPAQATAAKPAHAATQARRIADRWARTDHRMAADLYCAADRDDLNNQ